MTDTPHPLVTEDDTNEPVCDGCGHTARSHGYAGCRFQVWSDGPCGCVISRPQVTAAHWTNVVRREIAAELDAIRAYAQNRADIAEEADGGKLARWDGIIEIVEHIEKRAQEILHG